MPVKSNTNISILHYDKKAGNVIEPPGQEEISDLFPPSALASPSSVANVLMKLPGLWPDAAEVWFAHLIRDP